ncbi:MAG: amino acid racemase [Lachnospiraceae bacterium]|nr:amino acid racemase [Lachnospiraceae bacterium]
MKKLGIIGGMGPLATARLFETIVELTKSDSDAGHIRTLIDCNPGIPDRTRAILDGGESPVPEIVKTAKGLITQGAEVLLLACNTSHYYFEEIENALREETVVAGDVGKSAGETGHKFKLINLIEETGKTVLEKGMTRVGVLATRGAVEGRVFDKYLTPMGIECVYPDPEGQKVVNALIYDAVKAGRDLSGKLADDYCKICKELFERGAQALILGCTEIPIAMKTAGIWERLSELIFIDSIEVLAKVGIREAEKT